MPMLIIQLAILIAVAFVIGCVLGRLIRGKKAADTDKENTIIAAALSKPAVDENPEPVASTKAVVAEEPLKDKFKVVAEAVEEPMPQAKTEELESDPESIEEVLVEEPIAEFQDPDRPELLDTPLRGKPDDLTAINGIGKAVEGMLQKLGVFHYAQIAQWNMEESAWIERHIGFSGRVARENWTVQASKLTEATQRAVLKKNAKPKKAASKSKAPTRTKKTQA
ncbi:endonuclease [Ochrobactrum sp. AN78]|uniref:endonuclease n=1 Tax=Ochrobactrum sp. AN78 TaxID=3039853 RepID=UPI002989BDE3|nr:endonuclease [Ochrobactrum sp. AN78]MDH7791945.1 putative flap endonuclease-1-like 5' DNA nuclease [Ochrobactrum sp. AN78]